MAEKNNSDDLYRLINEPGKHLADSRNTPGAKRGTYLDDITNKPCGAGEFIKVDIKDYSSTSGISAVAAAALASLALAAGYGIAKATPYVKKWITESAVPWIKVRINKLGGRESNRRTVKATVNKCESVALDEQVFYARPKETMTSAQAQKELIDAYILIMNAYKKANRVANADIILPSGEIVAETDILLNQQIIDQINAALTNNPDLLSKQQALDLTEILGYPVIAEGAFLPLSSKSIASALDRR